MTQESVHRAIMGNAKEIDEWKQSGITFFHLEGSLPRITIGGKWRAYRGTRHECVQLLLKTAAILEKG